MLRLDDQIITPTRFPDGTSQVWKIACEKLSPQVKWIFESEAELIRLAQLRALLQYPVLWMPYLPYGRQDKPISDDATFALRPFAKIINGLNFSQVQCFDPHSAVAEKCFDRFMRVRPDRLIAEISASYNAVCFPDEGAAERYSIPCSQKIIGHKVRDQATGRITSYQLDGADSIDPGLSVLVVDDICDGGATFLLLGEELRQRNINASLYVSHGIFSRGLDELRKHYDRIYTTDSRPIRHQELIVYESAAPHRLLQG